MEFRQKKDKNLTEEEREDGEAGSVWDHTAVDARTKLIISLEQSLQRDQAASDRLVDDMAARTRREPPSLVTTDEHPQYANSLKKTYGKNYRPRRRKKKGPKRKLKKRVPKGMVYATVNKTRERGRVTDIKTELVYGTVEELNNALLESPCSSSINTAFVERNNGTARHFNARKQRRTYCFSKQFQEHAAMSWLMVTHYNFCWALRTLRIPLGNKTYVQRSPAMAAGIADHVWTVRELLAAQVIPRRA